jgi:pyruvate/2-oxoglutarate dehydrogenase complex dihydrolipoamide dehydrogenase (E3) component
MRHIAVIGSGPAGYYTAEACQKTFGEDVRSTSSIGCPCPSG